MATVSGRSPILLNDILVNVDTSFKPISFQYIYAGGNTVLNAILDVNYDPLRPNIAVTLTQNSFISINNTANGYTGSVQITTTTTGLNIHFNGVESYTNPLALGPTTIHFSNTAGLLTFS